jgi:hypothetical protein
MTVKELVAILNTLPSDATVVYAADRFVADEVIYDDYDNTVTFAGSEEFGIPSTCNGDCSECHEPCQMNQDIPDDVDETNYDPYCGCDMFEICGSIDEEW